jgi:hypothetical protein
MSDAYQGQQTVVDPSDARSVDVDSGAHNALNDCSHDVQYVDSHTVFAPHNCYHFMYASIPMKHLLLSIVSMLVMSATMIAQQTKTGSTFGDAPSAGKPVTLSAAVTGKSFNAPLQLTATVREVCQKKGCWMIMADGKTTVRVTFKDYGFFVPKDLAGRSVLVEGVLTETVISEADARHYAEDAGKPKAEIAKIKGDQRELGFEAMGVKVVQ